MALIGNRDGERCGEGVWVKLVEWKEGEEIS